MLEAEEYWKLLFSIKFKSELMTDASWLRHSDVQAVQAFGTEFRSSKARDFEVIIDANGYINYSKLLAQVSGESTKFKNLCEWNVNIFTLIYDYEKEKIDTYLRKSKKSSGARILATEENAKNTSLPKTLTISQLVDANVFIVYSGGSQRELWGTYGPRYLLDVLIMITDVRYYRCIHATLEAIDAYAIENNKSFAGELERIQEQYEEKLKRSKTLMKEKDEAIRHYKNKNRGLLEEIKELKEDIESTQRNQKKKLILFIICSSASKIQSKILIAYFVIAMILLNVSIKQLHSLFMS